MDLKAAIEKRRTIRRFLAPPTEEQLERLLDAGAKAPSAGNKQAWFVVVITEQETVRHLGNIKKRILLKYFPDTEKGKAMLRQQENAFNNCTTLMIYSYAPEEKDPHRYDMGSAWLFVENLCLAALEENLGTQIVAFWEDGEEEIDKMLGVPSKFRQCTAVNIGVPDPSYEPPKKVFKSMSKWVFHEKWPEQKKSLNEGQPSS
jgi:nitroreductase